VIACAACGERPAATRDSAGAATDTAAAAPRRLASDATVRIFSTTSLAAPMGAVADSFAAREAVSVIKETARSGDVTPNLTESTDVPDIIALADAGVFDRVLMPTYTTWYVRFARNRVVIAYRDSSRGAAAIDSTNWWRILQRRGVRVGRADPGGDANAYRPLIVMRLAESHYRQRGLASKLLATSPSTSLRPTEADLIASLQAGQLDYIWVHESAARAAQLAYVRMPHEIDLGNPADSALYAAAEIVVADSGSTDTVRVRGEPILYGLSIPTAAPSPRYAERFLRFLFSEDGRRVMRAAHLDLLSEPVIVGPNVPPNILAIVGVAAPESTTSPTDTMPPPSSVVPPGAADTARRQVSDQPRRRLP
jgi:molybdate/tungstate transport system substrate-binding protein